MNIKNILKNNAMALIAFATIIGFSAFKLADKNIEVQEHWFAVADNGDIAPSPSTPGSECENNPSLPLYCAVAFSTPTPPVSNMSETDAEDPSGEPTLGIRYKQDDSQ